MMHVARLSNAAISGECMVEPGLPERFPPPPIRTAFSGEVASCGRAADLTESGSRSCLEIGELKALAVVHTRGVQLVCLRRPLPPELRTALADVEGFGFIDLHATLDPSDSDACERLFSELGPLAWVPALKRDVLELARAFAGVAARSTVHVTLESIYGESCRKWHTDRVGLRMIVTYHGPGTLCAEASGVDRSWLGSVTYDLEETNRRIVSDPTCIVEASAGDVLLCKGDVFPGEDGRGLVHRSPSIAIPGSGRLLLRIDERGCGE
jgi:hypothetical protein